MRAKHPNEILNHRDKKCFSSLDKSNIPDITPLFGNTIQPLSTPRLSLLHQGLAPTGSRNSRFCDSDWKTTPR